MPELKPDTTKPESASNMVLRLRARANDVGYPKSQLYREAADTIERISEAIPANIQLLAVLGKLRGACDEIMEREKDGDLHGNPGRYAIAEEIRDCIDEEIEDAL